MFVLNLAKEQKRKKMKDNKSPKKSCDNLEKITTCCFVCLQVLSGEVGEIKNKVHNLSFNPLLFGLKVSLINF